MFTDNSPFRFLPQHLAYVPILAVKARTASDQIDIIYDIADDPATPRDKATRLASLAARMMKKKQKIS